MKPLCRIIGMIWAAAIAGNFVLAAEPQTMTAVVARQYGGPEVLQMEQLPIPEPKENEGLVRVIASGVNPADPLILGGKYAKEFGTHLPLVLGYDMAGTVVKTGAKETNLKAADRFMPICFGAAAGPSIASRMKPSRQSNHDRSALPKPAQFRWRPSPRGRH